MISNIIDILLIFIGLKWNIYVIYILFMLIGIKIILKKNVLLSDKLLILCIYSVILPDNYSTEFLFILYFVLIVINSNLRIKQTKYNIVLFGLISLSAVSSVFNFVPVPNIIFSIMSFAPFIIFLCLIGNSYKKPNINISEHIDKVFFIELISVPINFICYYGIRGDDWSTGTFGTGGGEQAQLFIIAAFFAIYYFYSFINYGRKRKNLLKSILSIIILFSTNSWTLLFVFVIGMGLSYLININAQKVILFLTIILFTPCIIFFAIKIMPDSVVVPITNIINDREYFDYRFHKAVVYGETFFEIPLNDFKFALIGNGVGNYNSRAALICTGEYVDFYNKLFEPSISEYTKEYIFDYVKLAHDFGGSDYGSVIARPYSSIMALMGECGYLGLFIFIILLKILLDQKSIAIKKLIVIWLAFCMVENYFEYSKILLMLYICVITIEKTELIYSKRKKGI